MFVFDFALGWRDAALKLLRKFWSVLTMLCGRTR